MRILFGQTLFIVSATVCLGAGQVDFKRDVQPILEKRCYECHGEKKQKSGIRFDRKSTVFKPGDSGKPAVVPHKSAESLLIERVTTTNDEDVMPPKGGRLTAEQIATLRLWIDQGAAWPDDGVEKKHWAYEKPVRPAVPHITPHGSRIANPIDAFVFARLEKEGLQPSLPADRATLLRRVSLDLIGLPPTLEEVDAFLHDQSAGAYERVVDHLLASPHYGERWARPWLDLARYADTQGYEKDNRRTMWPYRDWVINAFNADMPFDEFTVEQLAGDLLPGAKQEQKTATGFHRNTMTNTEGGTDDEEFRYEAVVDRVNTTWAVWMGSTFNCAQCHNHKYDPFTTKEYYEFMAFLNNTADADKDDERPTVKLFKAGQEEHLAKLREALKASEKQFNDAAAKPEIAKAQSDWEQKTIVPLTNWQVLDPTNFVSAGGATLTKTESKSIAASGSNPSNDTYTVIANAGPGRVTGVRLEILENGDKKVLGRHENGSFVLKEFAAALGGKMLIFTNARADYSQKEFSAGNLISGKGNGWAVDASDEKKRVRRSVYFTLAEPRELKDATAVTFTLKHSDKFPGANVARFRLYTTSSKEVAPPASLPDDVRTGLVIAADKRDEKQRTRIKEYFQSIAPELKEVREELASARDSEKKFYDSLPSTLVMQELEKARETHRHIRGAYLSTAELVTPGTPANMHPFPSNYPSNRLGLARWIVSTNNPLTARVIVNRFWEQIFGKGIVETVEEFGKQGEPPSHPELLDWLAWEFMEPSRTGVPPVPSASDNSVSDKTDNASGHWGQAGRLSYARAWSIKALLKTIVMSSTYQQSSRVTTELLARDPYNRLLARGPRVRLEAEMIRDQALTVSGLLSHKVGGPSVMPPQPDGLWQVVYSGDKWETSKGEDKYRRGLYTFWRRSMPHPMMVSFDAPSREYCVLRRNRSDTPLQSLNLLNDPAFVECAQALARKVVAQKAGDQSARLKFLFRTCLARAPRAEEIERLLKLYDQELANYRTDSKAAEKMATSEIGKVSDATDLAELAAWTVVANVLLNLDEMITKG